ncbi:hypothetical protein [Shinella sp.]|uniref:hypothetical protein n=1 Tax=Shinella sp. TaxID=1870904 RepID=UPI00289E89AF|nr:hypothetical protein [Shinella sp.]
MKSGEPSPLYLFRSQGFAASGDTVVSVAPLQHVVAVYGGGGTFEADGLSQAFGGAAIFRNDATGAIFAGVWGARNAARFRREMREHMDVVLRREAPDARLVVWSAEGKRPPQRRDDEG